MAGGAPLRLHFGSNMSSNSFQSDEGATRGVTNSAQLAKAEAQIKALSEENTLLKSQVSNISSLYNQLMTENKTEKFDERRVMLLKSQIIQLERQVLLLKEAVGGRSATLLDVGNSLAATVNFCRSMRDATEKGAPIKLSRADFERIIETIELARAKLYFKSERNCNKTLRKPIELLSCFIRNDSSAIVSRQPITMFDVCSGDMGHINLKYVSCLETQLVAVYKYLVQLDQSLRTICSPASEDIPRDIYQLLSHHVAESCDLLRDTSSKLLELSLLIPAAPLPILTSKPLLPELTVDSLIGVFKNRNKSELRTGAESVLKAVNYTVYMAKMEKSIVTEELGLHKDIYHLQTNYVEALLNAIKREYLTFEDDIQSRICRPLEDILQRFSLMKDSTDEASLRGFLKAFKDHAPKLTKTIKKMSATADKRQDKENAISEFGRQFFTSLNSARRDSGLHRDTLVSELLSLNVHREEQLRILNEASLKSKSNSSLSVDALSGTSHADPGSGAAIAPHSGTSGVWGSNPPVAGQGRGSAVIPQPSLGRGAANISNTDPNRRAYNVAQNSRVSNIQFAGTDFDSQALDNNRNNINTGVNSSGSKNGTSTADTPLVNSSRSKNNVNIAATPLVSNSGSKSTVVSANSSSRPSKNSLQQQGEQTRVPPAEKSPEQHPPLARTSQGHHTPTAHTSQGRNTPTAHTSQGCHVLSVATKPLYNNSRGKANSAALETSRSGKSICTPIASTTPLSSTPHSRGSNRAEHSVKGKQISGTLEGEKASSIKGRGGGRGQREGEREVYAARESLEVDGVEGGKERDEWTVKSELKSSPIAAPRLHPLNSKPLIVDYPPSSPEGVEIPRKRPPSKTRVLAKRDGDNLKSCDRGLSLRSMSMDFKSRGMTCSVESKTGVVNSKSGDVLNCLTGPDSKVGSADDLSRSSLTVFCRRSSVDRGSSAKTRIPDRIKTRDTLVNPRCVPKLRPISVDVGESEELGSHRLLCSSDSHSPLSPSGRHTFPLVDTYPTTHTFSLANNPSTETFPLVNTYPSEDPILLMDMSSATSLADTSPLLYPTSFMDNTSRGHPKSVTSTSVCPTSLVNISPRMSTTSLADTTPVLCPTSLTNTSSLMPRTSYADTFSLVDCLSLTDSFPLSTACLLADTVSPADSVHLWDTYRAQSMNLSTETVNLKESDDWHDLQLNTTVNSNNIDTSLRSQHRQKCCDLDVVDNGDSYDCTTQLSSILTTPYRVGCYSVAQSDQSPLSLTHCVDVIPTATTRPLSLLADNDIVKNVSVAQVVDRLEGYSRSTLPSVSSVSRSKLIPEVHLISSASRERPISESHLRSSASSNRPASTEDCLISSAPRDRSMQDDQFISNVSRKPPISEINFKSRMTRDEAVPDALLISSTTSAAKDRPIPEADFVLYPAQSDIDHNYYSDSAENHGGSWNMSTFRPSISPKDYRASGNFYATLHQAQRSDRDYGYTSDEVRSTSLLRDHPASRNEYSTQRYTAPVVVTNERVPVTADSCSSEKDYNPITHDETHLHSTLHVRRRAPDVILEHPVVYDDFATHANTSVVRPISGSEQRDNDNNLRPIFNIQSETTEAALAPDSTRSNLQSARHQPFTADSFTMQNAVLADSSTARNRQPPYILDDRHDFDSSDTQRNAQTPFDFSHSASSPRNTQSSLFTVPSSETISPGFQTISPANATMHTVKTNEPLEGPFLESVAPKGSANLTWHSNEVGNTLNTTVSDNDTLNGNPTVTNNSNLNKLPRVSRRPVVNKKCPSAKKLDGDWLND